jgi:hypothetical protein
MQELPHVGEATHLESEDSFWKNLQGSAKVLGQKPDLLAIGIIDSCFKIGLNLFLFIWVPLLEETCGTFVHPGAIFVCFMFARLIGAELLIVKYSKLLKNSSLNHCF